MRSDHKPGIFWTWQDLQVEDRRLLEGAIDDMAAHGFGTLLVQPRGCRYPVDDQDFMAAVSAASGLAHERGLALWLHLDPRSMSRSLSSGEVRGAEFLIVAGVSDAHLTDPRSRRPLDVVAPIGADGSFTVRLEYPKTRAYHVHSDGAFTFRPLRLERCLAFRLGESGVVLSETVHDVTSSARLFTNELSGYVEVFGRSRPPAQEGWSVLALIAFGSNYPDFANDEMRSRLGGVLEGYAALESRPDGLWWDEPGYCTGFDRAFRADRGRIPWGPSLASRHRSRTGRAPEDDALYLLFETDDGLWGTRREQYYRTVEEAVFGAQEDLGRRAVHALGENVRLGVHQTWHQNADDVINGCADWWRGARVLGAGFTDVGDAERVDDPRQMAEVIALGVISVSLGRCSEREEAYYNLWGVEYGEEDIVPGPEVLDWWVDLQATLGCNWLAHTYGPTGYFERPSVWGPGYPDHPTWSRMTRATHRLARVLELAQGRLPEADIALVYPLGTLFRLGSELANPLAQGAHRLIDCLTRAGYELDVVSPEELRKAPHDRYRGVLYLHPFGASPVDVEDLARRSDAGMLVIAAGLPPVAGNGYASAQVWRELLDLPLPESTWPAMISPNSTRTAGSDTVKLAAARWHYRGVPHWGRPLWFYGSDEASLLTSSEGASYLGLLLEGLEDAASGLLSRIGLDPAWQLPAGAIASRTKLPDGATLLRLCPARFGRPFHGILRTGGVEIEIAECHGLLCLLLDREGRFSELIAPEGVSWSGHSAQRGGLARTKSPSTNGSNE